jgi:hypothetical protein
MQQLKKTPESRDGSNKKHQNKSGGDGKLIYNETFDTTYVIIEFKFIIESTDSTIKVMSAALMTFRNCSISVVCGL